MAQSNSSYTTWDRLYDAIYAVEALTQIFSTFEAKDSRDVDCFVSVFSYVGTSLTEARDAYLDELAANCHKPMAVPAEVLGDAYVPGPSLEASNG